MEERSFKVTLADGTQLTVTQNGNCYICKGSIAEEVLTDDNLLEVIIDGQHHENLTCCNQWVVENGDTWFILREKTAEELEKEELNLKIDFLMTMQGVIE